VEDLEFLNSLSEEEKEDYHLKVTLDLNEKIATYEEGSWTKATDNLPLLNNRINNSVPKEDDFEGVCNFFGIIKGDKKMKGKKMHISSLPGFRLVEGQNYYVEEKSWWFVASQEVTSVSVPSCLKGAKAWDIPSEGIYIVFPDDSRRLVFHSDWKKWLSILKKYHLKLIARQGDLLAFTSTKQSVVMGGFVGETSVVYLHDHEIKNPSRIAYKEFQTQYGGYTFDPDESKEGKLILTFIHPEHDKVIVEVPKNGCWVMLLPGTSTPGKKKID